MVDFILVLYYNLLLSITKIDQSFKYYTSQTDRIWKEMPWLKVPTESCKRPIGRSVTLYSSSTELLFQVLLFIWAAATATTVHTLRWLENCQDCTERGICSSKNITLKRKKYFARNNKEIHEPIWVIFKHCGHKVWGNWFFYLLLAVFKETRLAFFKSVVKWKARRVLIPKEFALLLTASFFSWCWQWKEERNSCLGLE